MNKVSCDVKSCLCEGVEFVINKEKVRECLYGVRFCRKNLGKKYRLIRVMGFLPYLGDFLLFLFFTWKHPVRLNICEASIFYGHRSLDITEVLGVGGRSTSRGLGHPFRSKSSALFKSFFYYLMLVRKQVCKCSKIERYAVIKYIVSFFSYRELVEELKASHAVCVDDFIPELVGLMTALKSLGCNVVVISMHPRPFNNPPPHYVDMFLYWRDRDVVYDENVARAVYRIESETVAVRSIVSRLDSSPSRPVVGIVSNATVDLESILEYIEIFSRNNDVQTFVLRPHPRVVIDKLLPDDVYIDDSDDLIFMSNECDYVVCNFTSAGLKLMQLGCPVLYDHGLDNENMEDTNFANTYKIYDKTNCDIVDINDVDEFYLQRNRVSELEDKVSAINFSDAITLIKRNLGYDMV